MSELTVITTEELGSSVGSLGLRGQWRAPGRLDGVRLLDRPWHHEELALPLGAIAVRPKTVLYWENRRGEIDVCTRKRAVYLLGLTALPVALEVGETNEELVSALANPRQAHLLGYEASRHSLAALVRRYVEKDAALGAHYIASANAIYSRHYVPPEDPEVLFEAIRARHAAESSA